MDRDLMQYDDEVRLPVRRSLAKRRWQRKRAICRKRGIVRRVYIGAEALLTNLRFCGRLAKGKVHCSCSQCRRKSWIRPTVRALRQRDAFRNQMKELDV